MSMSGVQKFSKYLGSISITSSCQKCGVKQVPYWGPINTRRHGTELFRSFDLVPRIYVQLTYVYLALRPNMAQHLSFPGLFKIFYKRLRGRFAKRVYLLQDVYLRDNVENTIAVLEWRNIQGVFFCFTDKRLPRALVSFIILSKGHSHCDRLSISHRALWNHTEKRLSTRHWKSTGLSVGPALIGQAGTKHPIVHALQKAVEYNCLIITSTSKCIYLQHLAC